LSESTRPINELPEDICLSCGFCCNGVIFADVKFQPRDEVKKLLALGLKPISQGRKFEQPCAAFCEGRCRIYSERPQYCHEFECLVLKRLKNREVTREQALGTIRQARRQADEVFLLLHALGDTDLHKPLAARLRQTTKRLEELNLDKVTAAVYGQLTVAVQKLHCSLSESFYPG
jgi:Fe-S-cluster containining protein